MLKFNLLISAENERNKHKLTLGKKLRKRNVPGETSNIDANQPNTSLNKVNSSEFDPLQDSKAQKNGAEDVKESSKPSTPQVVNNEGPSSRPQSVSMASTPSQQQSSIVTSAANPHSAAAAAAAAASGMTDYFGRSSSSFPGMQYGSLPYPQQYNFQSTG